MENHVSVVSEENEYAAAINLNEDVGEVTRSRTLKLITVEKYF